MPRSVLLVLLILAAALPLFFVPLGHDPVGPFAQLNIFVHLAFFALLAWALVRMPVLAGLSPYRQITLVFVAVLILGGSIELLQGHIGRTASWKDLGVNLTGGLFGLLFLAPGRVRMPWMLLRGGQGVVLALCLFLLYKPVVTLWDMNQAARQFPVLSDFETRFQAERWTSGEIDRTLSRTGRSSLRVELNTDTYSGTTLWRSFGNWENHEALNFSIYNPDPEPLVMTISIRDREHSRRGSEYRDRFNRKLTLDKGWNDIVIPVSDIENAPAERTMDLSRLTYVVIFAMNLPEPRTIYLDNVRLIP